MYYHIKKVGETRTPKNPFLQVTMAGYNWSSKSYAYKFATIEVAKEILDLLKTRGQKVFMTWHDDSKDAPYGSFGEVNPYHLSTIGA